MRIPADLAVPYAGRVPVSAPSEGKRDRVGSIKRDISWDRSSWSRPEQSVSPWSELMLRVSKEQHKRILLARILVDTMRPTDNGRTCAIWSEAFPNGSRHCRQATMPYVRNGMQLSFRFQRLTTFALEIEADAIGQNRFIGFGLTCRFDVLLRRSLSEVGDATPAKYPSLLRRQLAS
jgi:hypothetical protein